MASDGVYIPRWLMWVGVFVLLAWFGLRILIPPSWIVQRLDAPVGDRSAQLMRNRYLRENFSVHVKEGWFWQILFYSDPITNDYRVDLGERLIWSENGERLYLEVGARLIWGYDFGRGTALSPAELKAGIAGAESSD